MTFKVARYSGLALTWTITFVVVFLYFLARVIVALSGGARLDTLELGFAILLGVATGYAWLRSVKRYRLADDRVVSERGASSSVIIPRDETQPEEKNPAS